MSEPVDKFLATLRKSALVTDEDIDRIVEVSGEASVENIADALIAENLVSSWQIEQIKKGRYKGFLLGDFVLLELIGSGGMSKVFRARKKDHAEELALKVLPLKKLQGNNRLDRFFDEAKAASELQHPNIVATVDFGKGGPTGAEAYYLVMELLDGLNFQQFIEQHGPVDWREAARFIEQASRGLHHAHSHDFIHRDIKPSNFALTDSGDVKLLDLGLALSTAQLENTTEFVGSVDYLSPEQANGNEISKRCDIFGLGGVFYFLLTGKSPYHEYAPAERLAAIQNEQPSAIEESVVDLPSAIVEIIARMLNREPSERFETAAEVAEALHNILAEQTTNTREDVEDDLFSDIADETGNSVEPEETAAPSPTDEESADALIEVVNPADQDSPTLISPQTETTESQSEQVEAQREPAENEPIEEPQTTDKSPDMADKKNDGLPDFDAISRAVECESEAVSENPFANLNVGDAPAPVANPFEVSDAPAAKPPAPVAKPAAAADTAKPALPANAPTATPNTPVANAPIASAAPAAKPPAPLASPAEPDVVDFDAFEDVEEVEDVEDIENVEDIEDVEDIEEVADVEPVDEVEDVEETEAIEEVEEADFEPANFEPVDTESDTKVGKSVPDVPVASDRDMFPPTMPNRDIAENVAGAASAGNVQEASAVDDLAEHAPQAAGDSVMLFKESGPLSDVDYLPESDEPEPVATAAPASQTTATQPTEEPAATIPVGIDLGTTYSVVAHLDESGRPWTLSNAEGDITTPSVVFFEKGKAIVGKEAMKAAEFEPEGVARYAKRNMGEKLFEKQVRGENLPPEVLQALVLQKLKADAELKLGPIRKAVVTVPAYFNEPRRKATQDAGRLAGLEVLDIINEPTAAAICYGVQQGFLNSEGKATEKELILVYDLGGGTFDVTLTEIVGGEFNAVATAGDVQLGGVDWDMRIVDHIAAAFLEEHGVDIRDDAGALQAALAEASDAKHALTARDEVNIHFAHQGNRLRISLTREEFENASGDLLDRTLFTTNRVLREAKRSWKEITRLLLVGGSTRMPMVQEMLERESGLKVDRSLSPDEAVAHGAAIYAGLLISKDESPLHDISVSNVNSHDLGVLGRESSTGMPRRHVLIPRNSQLPSSGVGKFVTSKKGQKSVKVEIIEGGDAAGKNATKIGKCIVTDLPPDLPAKTKVVVKFTYGANGRLKVEASIPKTNAKAKMNIERQSGLSADELNSWLKRIASGTVIKAE